MKAEFTVEEVPAAGVGPAPAVRVLRVGGEIDTTNAADFEALVNERAAAGCLVLDLSSVRYCDSAAFAALDRILAKGLVTAAMLPANPVHRAASIMGLPLHDTVEGAVRALGG